MIKKEYRFKVEAYDVKILQHLNMIWKNFAKILKLELRGPIYMPIKKKTIVLLRSPHVNKKSREKFIFKKYRILYCLSYFFDQKLDVRQFLFLIQKNIIAGSSVTLQKMTKNSNKSSQFIEKHKIARARKIYKSC